MNETTKELKQPKNLKEWTKDLYIANLITIVIEVLIFALIYFILMGPIESVIDTVIPGFTSMGFMILFIPYGIIVIPIEIIFGSRRDCIKGKWKLDGENTSETLNNPLRRLGLEAIIIGVILTIGIWLILWFLIPELLDPIISIIMSFCIVLIFTVILLRRHLSHELVSFWNAYKKKDFRKQSFLKYFFINYVIPWSLIMLYIVFNLSLRGFLDVDYERVALILSLFTLKSFSQF